MTATGDREVTPARSVPLPTVTWDIQPLLAAAEARGVERGRTEAAEAIAAQPRVWVLPSIPEDVKRLRDASGVIWERAGGYWRDTTGVEDSCRAYNLIGEHGPLTEVPDV